MKTPMQSLYLDQDGSRWTLPGYRVHAHTEAGYDKVRAVDFAESFGNFASLHLRIAGKRYSGLADSFPCECHDLPYVKLYPVKE